MNPDQQALLDSLYASIDHKEELHLAQSNSRKLSGRDTQDLHLLAFGSGTIDDLFEYARRPKIEVLQYMQERHPSYLERMLSSTLRKNAEES